MPPNDGSLDQLRELWRQTRPEEVPASAPVQPARTPLRELWLQTHNAQEPAPQPRPRPQEDLRRLWAETHGQAAAHAPAPAPTPSPQSKPPSPDITQAIRNAREAGDEKAWAKLMEIREKQWDADMEARESAVKEQRVRGAALGTKEALGGVTLGLSDWALHKYAPDAEQALQPQSMTESVLSGATRAAAGMIPAMAIGRGIGAATKATSFMGQLGTRAATAAVHAGTNQLALLAQGKTTIGEAIKDTATGMLSSSVAFLPEQLIPGGAANFAGQIAVDLATDVAIAATRGELKTKEERKQFLLSELPQLAISAGFAADDLSRYRADPVKFEAVRKQTVKEMADMFHKTRGTKPPAPGTGTRAIPSMADLAKELQAKQAEPLQKEEIKLPTNAKDVEVGSRVTAADRGNQGRVVSVDPEGKMAEVHFRNKKTGLEKTVMLPISELSARNKAGRIAADKPSSRLKEGFGSFVGYFKAFGRQRVENKPLYNKLSRTYHEMASSVERATDDVHKLLSGVGERTIDDSLEVVDALERKGATVSDKNKPLYEAVEKLRSEVTKAEQEAGVLGEGFPQSAINRVREKLNETTSAKGRRALMEDLKALEKFKGYMPHSVVARRVMQRIYMESGERGRRDIAAKLDAFHRQRKGRGTLKEYIAAGVIKPEDADVGKLAMDMAADSHKKLAVKGLLDWGESEGLIKSGKDVAAQGGDWVQSELLKGAAKTEALKGKRVHRLMALGLEELAGVGKPQFSVMDKVRSIGKVAQFFKPGIIWNYNFAQRHMRGMGEYRPHKALPQYFEAWRSVLRGDDRQKDYQRMGLHQNPSLPTRATADEMTSVMARQTRSDVGWLRKKMERATGQIYTKEAWKSKGGKAVLDALLTPYRAISNLTWYYDRVQRTLSAINLEGQGWSREDAVNYAARAHGGYSLLGAKYKAHAGKVFFVHSFRVLMPIEVGKSLIAPAKIAVDALRGKPMPAHKARTAGKAFLGTVAIPTIVNAGMKFLGWEPEDTGAEKYEGVKKRFGITYPNWKYKKTFMWGGKKREVVLGINDIVNMPTKWMDRFLKQRPEKLDDKRAALAALFKWEIHPIYRVAFDVIDNESSFQEGRPRRPSDGWGKQITDSTKYALGNIFRLYREGLNVLGKEDQNMPVHKKEQRKQLGEALNTFEKVLFTMEASPVKLGYAYTRKEKKARGKFYVSMLNSAIAKEEALAKRDFKGNPAKIKEELRYWKRERKQRLQTIRRIYNIGVTDNEETE